MSREVPFGWILGANGEYHCPAKKKYVAPVVGIGEQPYKLTHQFTPTTSQGRVNFTIKVCPMGAVRMNKSDAWKKRPAVLRYFAFKNVLKREVGELKLIPDGAEMVFHFPVMPSWSKKKQAAMIGQPHRSKPDKDNCEKAVLDSILSEDSGVWYGTQKKLWCKAGDERIELTLIYDNKQL